MEIKRDLYLNRIVSHMWTGRERSSPVFGAAARPICCAISSRKKERKDSYRKPWNHGYSRKECTRGSMLMFWSKKFRNWRVGDNSFLKRIIMASVSVSSKKIMSGSKFDFE